MTLFVIMSYYSVVGGWVLKYIFAYLAEPGFGNGTVSYQEYFVNFISEPVQPLAWGFVFLVQERGFPTCSQLNREALTGIR